jgi:hypothetical protein
VNNKKFNEKSEKLFQEMITDFNAGRTVFGELKFKFLLIREVQAIRSVLVQIYDQQANFPTSSTGPDCVYDDPKE